MKTLAKRLVARAATTDWSWTLLDRTLIAAASYARAARRRAFPDENAPDIPLATELGTTVRHGPFVGLQYPEMTSVGSALLPKILGSYERELHPVLDRICATPYRDIVVVGCAEGYYAVGLARRIETARVFAFDIDEQALHLCRSMAESNGVADRLTTGAMCTAETLAELPLAEPALIVSDCEGYEDRLFGTDNVDSLRRHDLLIEVHDFVDIGISGRLRSLFQHTHDIEVFSSVDDIKKAQTYQYDELNDLSLDQRRLVLREGRPTTMEWFFITPK